LLALVEMCMLFKQLLVSAGGITAISIKY